MSINRYVTPTVAMYNPMGLQELAFAPSFLRQRHDETNAAIQALNEQAGQYNVHGNFQDIAGQLIDPITQELTGLSSDLSQKGINESRGVDRLMQLNARQKELFSPRGAIGQLQSRTQQYQEQIQGISDFFKDNPELARFKLSQSNIGQATINPETGKLELGDMQIPNYVRHIADEDIMKQLNDAVKGLKPSDLARYGIQYTGSLGEFNDLFNVDRVKGVTPERIQALLGSLIGPEIQQSVTQYGEMMGYSPEESLGMLNNRLIGISNASAYQDTDSRYFNVQDDMRLYKAKKALEVQEGLIPYMSPSGRVASENINPFSKMKISEQGGIERNTNTQMLSPEYWQSAGYNVVNKPNGEFEVFTSGIGGNVPVYSSEGAKDLIQQETILQQEFIRLKNTNPELANLSDEKALEKINSYYENLTQRYGTSFKGNLNERNLADAVITSAPNASVWGPEGTEGELQSTLKKLGYSDYDEFVKEGHKAFNGLNLFGPDGKPSYEFTVRGSDGKKTSMFIEADLGTQQLAQNSITLNKMLLNGSQINPEGLMQGGRQAADGTIIPTMDVYINPIGTSSEPYKLQIASINNIGSKEQFEQEIAGKTSSEVVKILNSYGAVNGEDYIITPMNDIVSNERRNILQLHKQYNKQ